MRKKMIAGNWKMNKKCDESVKLASEIVESVKDTKNVEVVICPTYIALQPVSKVIANSNVKLGAQDMHWEDQGAFTGKICADMIKDISATFVIIGHSEQRTYFHETDESVNKKSRKAIASGLIPIICVGETLAERESNKTFDVIKTQIKGAYREISSQDALKSVIAYEPVWAIGTGKNATPEQAEEVHKFIRDLMKEIYNSDVADKIQILYGGSMKPDNAKGLMSKPNIDGGLIGGAALKADSFKGIIDAAM